MSPSNTNNAIQARRLHSTDIDNDGDIDVLTTWYGNYYQGDGAIAWYENDGNENFTEHVVINNVNGPYSVYSKDLDGDGDMDFLSALLADNKVERNPFSFYYCHFSCTCRKHPTKYRPVSI
jgi:hypothetical protein